MVTINASTTAGLVMTSDLSGTLSLQSNGVAVTMPAVAGTMMVSGNMPAFSAYPSASQTITASTAVACNTKEFDTAGAFNNTSGTVTLNGISVPAYSFAPPVAGYYIITAHGAFQPASSSRDAGVVIYKNGAQYKNGSTAPLFSSDYSESVVTAVIYMNGTSDYITSYVFQNSGSGVLTLVSGAAFCYFTGAMVRAA